MRSLLLPLAVGALALAGCSSYTPPPETDPARGREALTTVLNTWQRGGTPDELKAATPSITARDPDWATGAKLTGYEIDPESDRAGVDLVLTVKLTLVRSGGEAREKKVKFTVGIGATTSVLRNE